MGIVALGGESEVGRLGWGEEGGEGVGLLLGGGLGLGEGGVGAEGFEGFRGGEVGAGM